MKSDAEVFQVIQEELDYGRKKWEETRPEHPHSPHDADKSIAEWLTWMRCELDLAQQFAYQTYDKTDALHRIRALAAHAVNCLKYHDAPTRAQLEEEGHGF